MLRVCAVQTFEPLYAGSRATKYKHSSPFFVYRPLSLAFALRWAALLCLFDKCIAKFFQRQSKKGEEKRTTTSRIIRIAKEKTLCTTPKWMMLKKSKTNNEKKRVFSLKWARLQAILCKVPKENYGKTCAILFFSTWLNGTINDKESTKYQENAGNLRKPATIPPH